MTRVNVYRGPARQPGRAQFVLGAGGPGLGAKTLEELPANARAYIKRVEALIGAPIDIISTGPDRNETIVLRHPFA